jgi:hypothetical protein
MKQLSALVALALLAGLMALPTTAAPLMQGVNLLQNPNFEQGLEGWQGWYYENIVMPPKGKEPNLQLSFYPPDFITSEPKWDKSGDKEGERVAAAVSGLHYTKFRAGLYQTVDVPSGSRVRFSVWVNGFCEDDKKTRCPVILRAGIDPTGGTDWQSSNVQWVVTQSGNQQYELLTPPEVQVGRNGRVTVFAWGEPRYPVLYNAAYFDEASLVVTVPPTPTGAAPTAPPPPPTPVPCAQMQFVSDVAVPDNSPIAPNTQFVRTWRVQNSGTCAWSGTLNFIGAGNPMEGQSPTDLPNVKVGQTADVSIRLTAPIEPGSYQGTWEARTNDGTILGHLVVKINVIDRATTPMPIVPATPLPVATAAQDLVVSPIQKTGQVCVLAFNDCNGDGQQTADESLLTGAAFTLSDSSGPKETYTTDGANEPHCFADLPSGSYQLAMQPPADYSLTTSETMTVAPNGDMKVSVSLGAKRDGATLCARTADASANVPRTGKAIDSGSQTVLIIVAMLIMLSLGFAVGFLSMNRR